MTETILVVDDEEAVRRTFREWLEGVDLHCHILMAEDAESALLQANEHPIDLAILDWNLGAGNDGLKLLEDLQVFHPDVVAILITGFADQATPVQAMRMGVRDYLDKNQDLNRNTFLRAVRNQLDRIRPARRERAIQQGLRDFHDALEKALPLVQATSALQEPVPFADAARTLLRTLQLLTQASRAFLIVLPDDDTPQAFDHAGNTLEIPATSPGYSLASLALTFQSPVLIPDLAHQTNHDRLTLLPFEKPCRTLLAVPLNIGSRTRAVLELFDPVSPEGSRVSFREEDRGLATALVPLAEHLLLQTVADRQTRRLLLDAVQTALQSSRNLADTLQTPGKPDDPAPPAILETIRQGLTDTPEAAETVRLAEAIRVLSLRFGPAAIRHCITQVESVRSLLETTTGSGDFPE